MMKTINIAFGLLCSYIVTLIGLLGKYSDQEVSDSADIYNNTCTQYEYKGYYTIGHVIITFFMMLPATYLWNYYRKYPQKLEETSVNEPKSVILNKFGLSVVTLGNYSICFLSVVANCFASKTPLRIVQLIFFVFASIGWLYCFAMIIWEAYIACYNSCPSSHCCSCTPSNNSPRSVASMHVVSESPPSVIPDSLGLSSGSNGVGSLEVQQQSIVVVVVKNPANVSVSA